MQQASRLVRRFREIFYGDLVSPRTRYRKVVDGLGLPHDGRILSLGCGYTAPDLRHFNVPHGLKVGVDLVDGFDHRGDRSVRFCKADAGALPFKDDAFDAVVCRSLIEHLEDPGAVFREAFRVLAPDGRLVFLTPNRYDYVSLLASVVPNCLHGGVVRLTTGRDEKDTFPTRYRANTVGVLRRLAGGLGFELEMLDAIREHPNYLQFHALAYLLGVAYEKLVERNVAPVRPWILGVLRKPAALTAVRMHTAAAVRRSRAEYPPAPRRSPAASPRSKPASPSHRATERAARARSRRARS